MSNPNSVNIFGAPSLHGGGSYTMLGDAGYDPTTPAYLQWQASVKAKGGTVTVLPAPPGSPLGIKTPPAARYPNGKGGWTYQLAPLSIVTADTVQNYKNAWAIAIGNGAAIAENVAKAIAEAPQNAVSWLTGIPRWLVPAVLLGGGLLFAANKFGVKPRLHFAKNPRGRRRRRHASGARRRRRRAR